MKKYSIFFFFLFSANAFVFCQSISDVDQLNREAEMKLNQNPKEALINASEAKTQAEGLKYQQGINKAVALMAVAEYKIDNYERAKILIKQATQLCERNNDSSNLAFALYWSGNMDVNTGNFPNAIDYYERALAIANKINDKKNIARALDGKATIYEALDENDKALDFYQQSLSKAKEGGFKEWIPTELFAIANFDYKNGNTEDALTKFLESANLSDEVGNLNNKATCYHQIASIYYDKRDAREAMKYIQMAMDIFEETGAMSSFGRSRILMAYILLGDKEYNLAVDLAQLSFDEGKSNNETELQKDAAEALYYIYLYKGDKAKALDYHVKFYELSETGHREDLGKKMKEMEMKAAFEKEKEIQEAKNKAKEQQLNDQIERQKLVKKASFIGVGLFAIIAALSIFAFIQKRKDNRVIAAEKRKSDELLLNILPAEVAQELKESGTAKTKNYERATVLFADIKNFTGAAEKMSAEKLVQEIDHYFKNFDEIITRYKIEKIKTIGDAYLCVGGLPIADSDNANHVVSAAWEMQEFVEKAKAERQQRGEIYFEIRVGIHTGPLIAGIVGLRKFAYDIWGDTVNIAARMEQHGEEGRINISSATHALVKDKFRCTYRGKVEAKNKGEIDMYFVDGLA